MAVDYAYYSGVYGGSLTEAAFSSCVGTAESHVKWLCSVKGYCSTSAAFKRAVCAATDAFAEFGMGQVGGFSIGEFSVKNYENEGTTGEEMATRAALKELAGTGYAFAGVRNVKAARAVLADYGGDVEKMREAESWMFAEQPSASEGATGKTGLPNAGAASNAAGMEKHWMEVAGLEEEAGK